MSEFIKNSIDDLSAFRIKDIKKEEPKEVLVRGQDSEELDGDFEKARRGIAEVTKFGKEAIEEAIALARATDKPSAWEAVANVMKAVTDINSTLVDIHGKKADIKRKINGESGPTIQNNTQNNFNMTTTDLLEIIERQKSNK